MTKINISHVPRSRLYPAFGQAYENPPKILVRKDLPLAVQKFILDHEKCHIADWQRLEKLGKGYNWIWGELRASFLGGLKHPFGLLMCIVMSLHPCRLKLYVERFRKGE